MSPDSLKIGEQKKKIKADAKPYDVLKHSYKVRQTNHDLYL